MRRILKPLGLLALVCALLLLGTGAASADRSASESWECSVGWSQALPEARGL